MTLIMELAPIGTLVTMVTTQVLETAMAAHDVLFERESFRMLSQYLLDIQPVLAELTTRDLSDNSEPAKQALQALSSDVKAAQSLVHRCTSKSQLYLLVHCRAVLKDIHRVTRDIGKSLALLTLATADVSASVREGVDVLQCQMQNARYEASESHLRVVEKLEAGLRENRTDQGFANDLVREIAMAVGVSVEQKEMEKELASFKREKEEAAERKEREEAAFMEQVISLLSHADAAKSFEISEKVYKDRLLSLGSTLGEEEDISPLKSFICPLKKSVMEDPVSLSTGTTCEREEIQKWLDDGNARDPETGELLGDFTLRPNVPLKDSIQEWLERNWCLKIKASKYKLRSANVEKQKDALLVLKELCEEKCLNKDWIAIEGVIPIIIDVLATTSSRDIKRGALLALEALVMNHPRNKDKVVDTGGVEQAVKCLSRDAKISQAAVDLLHELLGTGSERNSSVYWKIIQQKRAILLLVTLLNGNVAESSEKAKVILEELCDNDDNRVQMAAANWYKPLIDSLYNGSDKSKVKMANSLAEIKLTEQNIKLLGDEGAVLSLVKMFSGNLESKASALGALKCLSVIYENKRCIAESGAVPEILEYLFSQNVSSYMREQSAIILERLTCNEGTSFLINGNGDPLNLKSLIPNLIALQQNSSTSHYLGRHAVNALLGMVSTPQGQVVWSILKEVNGISFFISLIDDSDLRIRGAAIKVLSFLSVDSPKDMSDFLLQKNKINVLADFLENASKSDMQISAARILANLPQFSSELNSALIESRALPALVKMLKIGGTEAKEYAIRALLRFTNPTNLETQIKIVEMGVYPILINMLICGSNFTKEKAALAIKNLSLSTPRLSFSPVNKGCWFIMHAKAPICRVHLGSCDVKTTLCLVKANALTPLVKLLLESEDRVVTAAVKALATLVCEDELLTKGSFVLHEVKAIDSLLEVLSKGSEDSVAEALKLLEQVFKLKEIIQAYRSKARISLVSLATNCVDASLRKKAAKLLARLEVS